MVTQVIPVSVFADRNRMGVFPKVFALAMLSLGHVVHANKVIKGAPTAPNLINEQGLIKAETEKLPSTEYLGLRDSQGKMLAAYSKYLGQDIRVLHLKLDPEMLNKKSNFGYTQEEIEKYFSQPVRMVIDETGLDRSYIKPPPAPFIHPRVIINPEDLPNLRQRLSQTKSGRAAMGAIRKNLSDNITGPQAKFAEDYLSLKNGVMPKNIDNNLAYGLMYEAFRCLIDEDPNGGKNVAAAITTFAQITQKGLDASLANPRNTSKNDARIISQGPSREFTLGLGYDFAYNYMTEDQRASVRKVLSNCTTGMTGIGCETLRSLHSGTSNWISWGCRALFAICAIEGEPGYDPESFKRFAQAQINFIASIYPTGEAFEGWGKNFMFMEHMVILAKRGQDLNVLGSTRVRNAYNQYYFHAMNPWGHSFTFCDSLARSGCKISRNADVLMYHTLFPNDMAGNRIFRNQIEENYDGVGVINTRHPFSTMDALCCAIFASDINAISAEQERQELIQQRPLTYFSDDTCNMITRSDWNDHALMLNYLNRAVPGGHQYADRSHFSLYGQGRFWSIYHYARQINEQYKPNMRSVVMADGEGPSTAEARCVAFVDQPMASFIATDISNPWNFENSKSTKPPAEAQKFHKTLSYNHFRLNSSPLPWMDLPIDQLPDWYNSTKPDPNLTGKWYRKFNVLKAFRSIGLIRGPHPYSLVIDDLQLDSQTHRYTWAMTLTDDIELESTTRVTIPENDISKSSQPIVDIILREKDLFDPKSGAPSTKKRKCLVRVLSAEHLKEESIKLELVRFPNPPQPDMLVNRLVFTSESVCPNFKLILYPYIEGDPLPQSQWNEEQNMVSLHWKDQQDEVVFSPSQDGRTRFLIQRAGNTIIHLK